jgi:hypothetical protein
MTTTRRRRKARPRKRKSVVKEKTIVKNLRKKLKSTVGGCWRKLHGGLFQSGMLDLLGCVKGRYIEIEVKRPGKLRKVSDLQHSRIREVIANGGLAFAADNVDQAVKRVKKWLRVPG